MISGLYWEKGARACNEDSVALEEVCTNRGDCTLLLVADGIGSLEHGEAASGYVAECMVRWFYEDGIWLNGVNHIRIRRSLYRAAYDCHRFMRRASTENDFRWGSTCTLICIWNKKYACMQIGDSSAYRFIGELNHIMHFVAAFMKRILKKDYEGRLCAMHTEKSGKLTACLGCGEFVMPYFRFGRIYKGDVLLVCSDGFLEKIDIEELTQIMHMGSDVSRERLEHRLKYIGMENAKRNARDNRSAVCVACV